MRRIALLLLSALILFAADNPWTKVKQLPDRSELRIYQRGAKNPLNATLADANDDGIVVVVAKNKQLTIAKDDIDRIDARPAPEKKKPTVTQTQTSSDPDYTPQAHPDTGPALPGTSSSSGVSFGGSKEDFRTVYIRPPAAPKK
jgi:hypothetical protein